MDLDIEIDGWPDAEDWEVLSQKAHEAIALVEPALAHPRLTTSVLFTSDEQVHELNKEWRGKDKPTNVLSFPMLEREDLLNLGEGGPPEMLGDIALAFGTCEREAGEKGISLADHTTHLLVHGFLHLAGHDHVDSDEQAAAMEKLEIEALAKLGIADPYGDRDK
ncbi:rRNA maturation RNase YbeY [Qipengyuania xiapuensis]|uniref:Endoribonuclease YbeY n=1 Tax=Qipengyuania xiapuensis TaxID=2867236 RepID=A0ABX8ZXH3_9SPHN|nr:rRNA maturation RNase YbeY [Qipengyuania xiapuensis]QZD92338.1 rRNA maturation RNase YbeY [Qipengyuania xiapuensis]